MVFINNPHVCVVVPGDVFVVTDVVEVLQAHASGIDHDMIAHESNVAVLSRLYYAALADDARSSSSLQNTGGVSRRGAEA